jgi:DNA repair protein RadC
MRNLKKDSLHKNNKRCYSKSGILNEPENKIRPDYHPGYQGIKCRVYLVRENSVNEQIKINNPEEAYNLVKDELINMDREVMLSILLTPQNILIGVETVCIGSVQSCMFTTGEVFKGALLANAVSIILCHNHPSGSLSPSQEDFRVTQLMTEAGKILGIRVLDHIIVTQEGYKSLNE